MPPLSISNGSLRAREIEVTSYAELVLGAAGGRRRASRVLEDVRAHGIPAARQGALIANRRRRAPDEPEVWASHHAVVEGSAVGEPGVRNRSREVHRPRTRVARAARDARRPHAVRHHRHRARRGVRAALPRCASRAGGTARIAFWTCVAPSRAQLLDLADKHRDPNAHMRAATLAWTQAQVQLRHLGIDASQANLFQQLAGHILFADAGRARVRATRIRRGAARPAGVVGAGHFGRPAHRAAARRGRRRSRRSSRQLLQAHEYWGIKRLSVDLVILNERGASYVQDLQMALEAAVRTSLARPRIAGTDTPRQGVRAAHRPHHLRDARTVAGRRARGVVGPARHASPTRWSACSRRRRSRRGCRAARAPRTLARRRNRKPRASSSSSTASAASTRRAANTLVTAAGGQTTPVPWINVIANRGFGFQVGSDGGGYTWSRNSRENALTPWSNDPVGNRPGEAIYLRDEETGELWTADAGADPPRAARSIRARMAWATAASSSVSHGLALELTMFVPLDDPIKICRLRVRNDSPRRRSISVDGLRRVGARPVAHGGRAAHHHRTRRERRAVRAQSVEPAVPGRRVRRPARRADRVHLRPPRIPRPPRHARRAGGAGGRARPLSGRTGAGLDPCAALRTQLRARARGEHRDRVPVRRSRRAPTRRARWSRRYRARRSRRAFSRKCAHTGTSSPATCR